VNKTRLCELAEKYGSDKVASIFHDYTPFYDQLLRDRDAKRVLEVGIGTPAAMNHVPGYQVGASLFMWRDYFQSAQIWGIDNDPSANLSFKHDIHTVMCDQGDSRSLTDTAVLLGSNGKFDLIIDDGSHRTDHQALTANTLIPILLPTTGVYVIEDVIQRRELYALLPWPVEVKIFNLKRTPDDCLFVIEGKNL
jgi:hypothetical protein